MKNQGSNDAEGFQIFTPKFIVEDMINTIDRKVFQFFSKRIREPYTMISKHDKKVRVKFKIVPLN
jgi:hypothetical protein